MSDEEIAYEVEAIRAWRYNKATKRREFLIKWKDYDEEENTWEQESNLTCPKKLREFTKSLSRFERRYFKAKNPEKLSGFQRNAKFVKLLGIDGPHESDDESSPKAEKQKLYLLVKFDDSDVLEEMRWQHFFEHKPDILFSIFENRLFNKNGCLLNDG